MKTSTHNVLVIAMSVYFVGCAIGVCYFGTDGFFVGAIMGIVALLVVPTDNKPQNHAKQHT